MLESSNSHIKTLVAEADSQVVGFMTLSSEFNLETLCNTFDVTCYDNFYKGIVLFNRDPGPPITRNSQLNLSEEEPNEIPQASMEEDPVSTNHEASETLKQSTDDVPKEIDAQAAPKKQETQLELGKNAFCIRLLYLEEPYHNNVLEVIKQTFNHFPDRDYCVVTVPTSAVEIVNLPVIQTKLGQTDNECLYVMNRFALTEPIFIRKSDYKNDLEGVKNLLTGLPYEQEILRNFKLDQLENLTLKPINEISANIMYYSFVAIHQGQIVGIAVTKTLRDHSAFINQYEVEKFVKTTHHRLQGMPIRLLHMVINPLFQHQSRWFVEEILRISKTTLLLYPVDDVAKQDIATNIITKQQFVPVKRRRQIQYPNDIRDSTPVAPIFEFPLSIITSSILAEPRIVINAKILVVGASDAGLSFLESLVYAPHVIFNNLTLVSKEGIPLPHPHFVNSECFTEKELKQIGLEYYVRVVKSTTKTIDRVNKCVKLENGLNLAYDYLILTPGVKFNVGTLSKKLVHTKKVYSVARGSMEAEIQTAVSAFESVWKSYKQKLLVELEISTGMESAQPIDLDANKPSIVVYGKHIQAYATVAMILAAGIPGEFVHLVVPKAKINGMGVFNNDDVEKLVDDSCARLGVHLYKGFKLVSWENTSEQDEEAITSVLVRGDDKQFKVIKNIEIFLYADEKTVDEETYKAINDSCLVFDGLFVIDKYFRTQDPSM